MNFLPVFFGSTNLFKMRLRVFMSRDERIALEIAFSMFGDPIRVLEWGSGGSTIHFSRRLPRGSTWHAIEHQLEWAERVEAEIERHRIERATVQYIGPTGVHVEGSGDGDEKTFWHYVNFPIPANTSYDVVLVDGRARAACLRRGWKCLTSGGFAALHDAQRQSYVAAIPTDAHLVSLRDPRKQVDGGEIELRFLFKSSELAKQFRLALAGRLSRKVVVTQEPAVDQRRDTLPLRENSG